MGCIVIYKDMNNNSYYQGKGKGVCVCMFVGVNVCMCTCEINEEAGLE